MKYLIIAIMELRKEWRLFVVYFVTSVLISAALLSAVFLTYQLPKTIENYANDRGYTYGSVTYDDTVMLEGILALPIKIDCVGYKISCKCVGLENSTYWDNEEKTEILIQGNAELAFPDERNEYLARMNKRLLQGNSFTENDNNEKYIWLSDLVAERLNVKIGDVIDFEDNDCQNELVVRGIYEYDVKDPGFYLSYNLYNDETQLLLINIPELKNIHPCIKQMKELGADVVFYTDEIDGLMLIMYAVYAIAAFICLLFVVTVSLARTYYCRRKRFFALLHIQGFRRSSLIIALGTLLQLVCSVTFLTAMMIAPSMIRYVIHELEQMIGDTGLKARVLTKESLLTYTLISVILWVVSVVISLSDIHKDKAYLIRRGNE